MVDIDKAVAAVNYSPSFNYDISVMPVAEVITTLSGISANMDTALQIYGAEKDAPGLPVAIRDAAERIPLVQSTLQNVKLHLKEHSLHEDSCTSIKSILKACKIKSDSLQKNFETMVSRNNRHGLARYFTQVREVAKSKRIEALMKGIFEDVHCLAENCAVKAATEWQVGKLAGIKNEVSALPQSVPEHHDSVSFRNFGTGSQNILTGNGPQNNNTSAGYQFNGTFTAPFRFPSSPTTPSPALTRSSNERMGTLQTSLGITTTNSYSYDSYAIAIICPMGVEMAPVLATLDKEHSTLPSARKRNNYILGELSNHNVVVTAMPGIGNNSATAVVMQLQNDFKSLRFGLLVGIGGGIPDLGKHDIRLGDVVVSKPTMGFGGVVQFDRGKVNTDSCFERTGHLNKPPAVLTASLETLIARHKRDMVVKRTSRASIAPEIHYGTIGSANIVIKDADTREKLKEELEIICVEMEAAGLMDELPCLVIRGVCDYADSHKNKRWQPYAAATAAAFTKELLSVVPL
ncbi:uncharacterized protein ATNIH1004_001658 [Aspergillus tanneri]|uniref:Nucleoside phosphorylase domain-containing protein n=1 Tax=Aspergillus tanneri TaxID=1220188 RepID=A0A5M9N638_9EURO|nr:uncharacterized protein ATNIH1004_001658 [Aspergillus tanneri]KAA8652753.1 hypothetical protein ATNIH1004_001658 [Aspergillus tanneri]